MNKNTSIIVGLILLILLGVGAVLAMKRPGSLTGSTQTSADISTPTPTVTTTANTQGTLKDLFLLTTPQTCTFTSPDSTTSGTIYAANKQLAGDFTSKVDNNTLNGHIIVASSNVYIWTDLSKMGIKMPLSQAENSQQTNKQGVGINELVSYSCAGWTVDESKFQLPKDITFSTFSLPSGTPAVKQGTTPSSQSNACSACNQLPSGPAQTACKTQLHCQ